MQALQTQQPYTADTVVMCSDGTKKITSWSLSDTTEAGERVITIRDVTQLRKMEDNLRRSQKMEAVGRLAGGIAHDFNNLLSIINGCSDLALEALDQPNKMKDYLTSIKNAGEKGASLVRQLIEFSRHNHEMQGAVDKACATIESVKKTIQMLTYYLGEGVKLEVIIADNIWGIHILALHLDQILVNLAINARDAMPNGGVLKIKIDNFYGRPEGLNEGKFVKIVVEDCGIGMDTETQKKVFDPFFSTKPIGRGTGLGLSSVYGIVQQYKGAIQLESQLGCGTKFTLFFPACEPENLNTPMCADSAMVKRCCLNLEAQIADNLKPLLLRQGWEICDKKMVNAIYISHDKQADVYVPRTFSEKTAVQHPLAFNQILHAMQNNRKGGE